MGKEEYLYEDQPYSKYLFRQISAFVSGKNVGQTGQ